MQHAPSLLVALALVAACGARPEEPTTRAEPPPSEPAPAPATPEPTTTAAFVPAVAGAPGPAYFTVDPKGVAVLDDRGFRLLEGSPGPTSRDLQIGPDGALWVLGADAIARLEGDRLVTRATVSREAVGAPADRFAVAPGGDLWISHDAGVARWDGAAWTAEDRAKIGAGDERLRAIAVDRDGRVWVATTRGVHVREDDVWRAVDLRKVKRGALAVQDLELGADGFVHLLIDDALRRFDATGTTHTTVPIGFKGAPQLSDVSFSLGGSIGIVSRDDVYHVPAGGSPRKYSSAQSRDFKADGIRTVAPDDAGRLWVGSDLGVAVIVPGAARVEWLTGSVPALVGKLGEIVVVGSGPVTLPTAGPQAKGGLSGKLLRDGAPAGDVAVELCPSPASAATKTPCDDAALRFTTRTDASGTWTVQDVPLGSYGLAIQHGKRWNVTQLRDTAGSMQAGVVHDTGSITLQK